MMKPRHPLSLSFWKRLMQNYRIGRDLGARPVFGGTPSRLRYLRDAFIMTRWGC